MTQLKKYLKNLIFKKEDIKIFQKLKTKKTFKYLFWKRNLSLSFKKIEMEKYC